MHLRLIVLSVAMVAGVVATGIRADEPVSFQDVEESLTCQCGCGLTVHSCNHVTCDSALPLRAEIRGLIENGKSREEILKGFAEKYGEKILSSPTTTGFNLLAWVTPFVVVAVSIAGVLLIVGRWGRRTRTPQAPAAPSAPRAVSANEQLMERELKSFDK